MFLGLAHTKLEVYKTSQQLTLECYRLTNKFPSEERYSLVQQVRLAATSVHLSIAEGCSRKSSAERNRFFEISRGSLIEIDSAIGIAFQLDYVGKEELNIAGDLIVNTFKMLTGLIKSDSRQP